MANADYRGGRLVSSIRSMIGRCVTGLAAIVSEMDPELIGELAGYRIPSDVDSLQGGSRATRKLLSDNPRLTAILCVDDSMAIGAMREIRDRGLRVPDDISVTGFEDIELAQFCYPALTSVRISRDQIAKEIWNGLVPNERTRFGREIVIEPELVLRESTGPAPTS